MARTRTAHRCTECGATSPKWSGRCLACGAWNTLVEELVVAVAPPALPPGERPIPITEVDVSSYAVRPTGVDELDRVLGGGLVPGSVTLLGGEPGVGKSTLLLSALACLTRAGARALYVSAEESSAQVRSRAERLDAIHGDLWLLPSTPLPRILEAFDELRPDVCVVDSIQTVYDPDLGSAPGSVLQVRECAHRLVREAKQRELTVLLVGHVTKEGTIAGPRVMEHVVDTVLAFEGERHHALRLLRAVKHRFGPTSELGVFEMTDAGLLGVADPSGLFLADRRPGVAGSVVVPTVEGQRPLLVEVQALLTACGHGSPRRSAQGVDHGRLTMLLAVLASRVGLPVEQADVFVSAVGGVRLAEPGADLGIALSIVSTLAGLALGDDLVICGEIGLGGELRQVSQTARRLGEAARLGFRTAIVPASAPRVDGIDVVRCRTVVEAIEAAALAGATGRAAHPSAANRGGRMLTAPGARSSALQLLDCR